MISLPARQRIILFILVFTFLYLLALTDNSESKTHLVRPRFESINAISLENFDDQIVLFSSRPRSFAQTWSLVRSSSSSNFADDIMVISGDSSLALGKARTMFLDNTTTVAFSSDGFFELGFMEGNLTADLIYQHYRELKDFAIALYGESSIQRVYSELEKHEETIINISDPQTSCIVDQIYGIYEGYRRARQPGPEYDLRFVDILFINIADELNDFIQIVDTPHTKSQNELLNQIFNFTFGSATGVKLDPDQTEVAHLFWTPLSSSTRLQRTYTLDSSSTLECGFRKGSSIHPVNKRFWEAHAAHFYGYAGSISMLNTMVHRLDSDFIVSASQFYIPSKDLYDSVDDNILPEFAFLRYAKCTFFSKDLKEWESNMLNFPQTTSGSGQYSLFQINRPWSGAVLSEAYSMEHIPNYSEKYDISSSLQKGQGFISLPVPCLPRTRKEAGFVSGEYADCSTHQRLNSFLKNLRYRNETLAKTIERSILEEGSTREMLQTFRDRFNKQFYVQSETILIEK